MRDECLTQPSREFRPVGWPLHLKATHRKQNKIFLVALSPRHCFSDQLGERRRCCCGVAVDQSEQFQSTDCMLQCAGHQIGIVAIEVILHEPTLYQEPGARFDHLIKYGEDFVMVDRHDALIRKLKEHSALNGADIAAICMLPDTRKAFRPNEDIVRQGDKPNVSVVVLEGMLARYHTLQGGGRQYLSLHIAGDWPDAQTLFLDVMDHAVCAIDDSVISLIPHASLLKLFDARPAVGFAVWRETLIDAAIFREAITNNSARPLQTRLAHFFCEQYYRARASGHAKADSCRFPLTQTQIGETVGASLPSISRALQVLRETGTVDLRSGHLHVRDWGRLRALGDFDPSYLHLRKDIKV
jgi:CRP-like cAMP-binding protein